MSRIYQYRTVHVRAQGWETARDKIVVDGKKNIEAAGGGFFGLFLPQIGHGINEGVIITHWPDQETALAQGDAALSGVKEIIDPAATLDHMIPTIRPTDDGPAIGPGVFAHRWFDVQEDHWDEFLALSDEAWPDMEANFDARIFGLWKVEPNDSGLVRALLLTRYADLSVWEASRFWGKSPKAEARVSMGNFRKRRGLTANTIVRTTLLA